VGASTRKIHKEQIPDPVSVGASTRKIHKEQIPDPGSVGASTRKIHKEQIPDPGSVQASTHKIQGTNSRSWQRASKHSYNTGNKFQILAAWEQALKCREQILDSAGNGRARTQKCREQILDSAGNGRARTHKIQGTNFRFFEH
jgi:hypothetical protein